MTKLVIDIPDSVALPPGLDTEQQLLREAVAVALYKRDRVSLREAREIVGLSRRGFEEMLGRYGVAMQDADDLSAVLDDVATFRH
jgi:predicted HTH domain antitoxin